MFVVFKFAENMCNTRLMEKISTMIQHIFERLEAILATLQGCVVGIGLLALNYIAGNELAVGLVVGITVMDAIWGIAVSIKRGKFALSELARLTVAKFAVYGCAMLTFIGIDKMIDMTLTTSAIATVIVLVEFWSSCGNMLIIYPEMPALKLLKKALIGEIASKLNITPEEVEGVLKEFEAKSKKKTIKKEEKNGKK